MSPLHLVNNLGYGTLFLVGVLGSMGLPVPEKSVLLVAGYLIWAGDLRLPSVIGLCLAAALVGANLAYWIGRALGRRAMDCCARRFSIQPERVDRAMGLVGRHGCLGIFASRFIPGVRFLANSLAGAAGLGPLSFSLASICAALAYLPLLLGTGYLAASRLDAVSRATPRGVAPLYALLLLAILACSALLVARRRRLRTVPSGRRAAPGTASTRDGASLSALDSPP